MPSSLWNLADNLAEGFHKDKCEDCKNKCLDCMFRLNCLDYSYECINSRQDTIKYHHYPKKKTFTDT